MGKLIVMIYLLWIYHVLSILWIGYEPTKEKIKEIKQDVYREVKHSLPFGYTYRTYYTRKR